MNISIPFPLNSRVRAPVVATAGWPACGAGGYAVGVGPVGFTMPQPHGVSANVFGKRRMENALPKVGTHLVVGPVIVMVQGYIGRPPGQVEAGVQLFELLLLFFPFILKLFFRHAAEARHTRFSAWQYFFNGTGFCAHDRAPELKS